MIEDPGFRYAGWFQLDLRLLASVLVLAASVAVLVVALWFRGRRWDEYLVGFLAVFAIAATVGLVLSNVMGAYPALRLETLFPIP